MNDLIERDKAMKVAMWFGTSEQKYNHSFIKKRVMEIPSVRPKEGKWILECDGEGECDNLYRCSECGCKYGCQEYDIPNFCPSCGARMKGADDE